jgi:hypothetical protein
MGLSFELEKGRPSQGAVSSAASANPADVEERDQKDQNSDDVIDQETKRRTFWSCFIMDRCLSTGKYRPRMIKVRDLGIQLPSDNAFAFGERVRTSRLNDGTGRRSQGFESRGVQIPSLRQSISFPDDVKLRPNGTADSKPWSSTGHRNDGADNGIDRWEVGAEECVLSRLIRVIRIWGSIAKWSCSGGRRSVPSSALLVALSRKEANRHRMDQYPPWHPESRFTYLRDLLVEFQDGLSRNLQYTQRNTDTHIMYKNTLASYSLMHIIYFLSVIVLHRAYIPFLPLRQTEPQGPLDEPSFPPDKYHVPESFWRDSARELFKAARQMMELVRTCQERSVLMETPLVGFAIYNAALIGVYAAHFNHMDQEGYMCSKPNSTDVVPGLGGQGQMEVRRAIELLGDMRSRLKMAVGWFRTINRLHSYFTRAKKDFKRGSRKLELIASPENDPRTNGARNLAMRDIGFGGGWDEFKLLDKVFVDFGSPEDQASDGACPDEDGTAVPGNVGERGAASETGSNAVKSESGDGMDPHHEAAGARRESWVPINSPVHGIIPPTSGPDGERPHEPNSILRSNRPPESDRWPNLPAPPPNYTLPSLQSHHPGPPVSTSATSPPSLTSPGSYASSTPSSLPQCLQTPVNRLQPLQPWLNSRHAPPPPYSQSLPSINTAAQHGFPIPPLSASPFNFTHPRLDSVSRSLPLDSANSQVWYGCLGGDDVLAFIEGGSYEQWPSVTSSHVGVASGWLSAVWGEYGQ